MNNANEKLTATLIHLSALTQYFIPFGNFIFPIIIWSSKKNESEFIDYNGKQTLNFQLSLFIYTVVLCLIAIPIFIVSILKNVPFENYHQCEDYFRENFSMGNITGIAILGVVAAVSFIFLKIIEFILVIHAAVKTSNGENYKYPLSIPFFK